ncbi:MAG: hypothetical protein AAFR87_35470 [Bacteroidota bacterium]
MPNFISVLQSDTNKPYWLAIQYSESLSAIKAQKYYSASFNKQLEKNPGDKVIGTKEVIEKVTREKGAAIIVELNGRSANGMQLSSEEVAHFESL